MSKHYQKIQSVFYRDPENNFKTLIEGEYSIREFEQLANSTWIGTEKIHGSNTTVMFDGETVTFGGKSDNSQIHAGLISYLKEKFTKENMSRVFDYDMDDGLFDVQLYGEGFGAGIQKGGGQYREGQEFILFDVRVDEWWLKRSDVVEVAKALNIPVVPVVCVGTLGDIIEFVRDGFFSRVADDETLLAEGIVAVPEVQLFCRNGDRVITKVKYRDFE